MTHSVSRRYALSMSVTCALLTGCSGSQPPTGAPSLIRHGYGFVAPRNRDESWMLAGARKDKLLYVSDDTKGVVYVISYPKGTRAGMLKGFDSPVGLCGDPKGNVWVVNQTPNEVIEFGHGDKNPKRTLRVPGFSYGCAVDSNTGDLAVTAGTFSVEVFENGTGTPTRYDDDDLDRIWYCGYDDHDDLFCSGENGYGAPLLAELPSGSTTLKTISLNFSIPGGSPGAVHWNGRELVIAKQSNFETNTLPIYRVRVVGSQGRLIATTELDGTDFCCGSEGWLHHQRYIGIDNLGQGLAVWPFPKGGEPLQIIPISGAGDLWGCVLSLP